MHLRVLQRAGIRMPGGSYTAIKWQQRSYRHFAAPCADSRIQSSMPFNEIESQGKFEILKEEVSYSRYLNVYNRVVKGQQTHEVGGSSRPPQTEEDIFRTQLVTAVTMFTQVMQYPRFVALLQPPPPSQSIGTKKQKSKPVKAPAQVVYTTESMETPVHLLETMQFPNPVHNAQEQVAETRVFQAVPVQPATFQQPIAGSNGQGSDLSYATGLPTTVSTSWLPRIEADERKAAADGYVTVEYDIVGSKTVFFHFCTVFPFNTSLKTVTLIKEYAQGANDFVFGVPTGGLSEKHTSLEDCVRKELSEEACLHEGTLIKLIPKEHPGILEVKWCRNRFSPFLVLDAKKDPAPLSQDPEEIIEVLNVDVESLKDIMYGGSMMLPSIVTCNMALHYLHDHNML
ncbi:hypothetical protein L7F22_018306 [Adiantum nelumboides]|nr:hypothetical protein [Adiantum nelumboides]